MMRADFRAFDIVHERPIRETNLFHSSYGNVPARENMRKVPVTFDGGDINDNGQWRGEEMGCLECREIHQVRAGITATYLLAQLQCGGCGERFAEYWV